MDNWQKIIEGYSKQSETNTIKYFDATIVSAREDFLRADVRLVTGQTISNMLNKSGEKIYEGQNVKIAYLTVPSKGWIALTNGEADPIREGGGGGWTVDTAAIVTSDIDNILIEQELMADITPETRLYYGGMPQFAVVQGHYCLLFGQSISQNNITYDSTTEKLVIAGDTELYDAILENKNKFGTQIGTADDYGFVSGSLRTSADGIHKYPPNYNAFIPSFASVTRTNTGWQHNIAIERWGATNDDPMAEWYGNLTHPTATNAGNMTTVYPRTPTNGNNNAWAHPISDFFLVPFIYNIVIQGRDGQDYGRVGVNLLLFATAEGYDGKYSVTYAGSNVIPTTETPLISAAEQAFMQGLYQRSEPQEVTP